MISNYFYHEIIRKNVIGFGTLFNNIYIKHKDSAGNQKSDLLVPIAYGPIQQFLARIEQQPDLAKKQSISLPRLSFEMKGISYDGTRKGSPIQTFKAVNPSDNTKINKVFMPVPYNLSFELNIISKIQDDALQILEQILPFFQPSFAITIDLVESIGEKKDTPIFLNSISMSDNYEGDYGERRYLMYTLSFTAKTNFFGPVVDNTSALIKKVKVDYFSSTDIKNAKREVRYTITPRALNDYNNDNTTSLAEDIDNKVTKFDVNDATALSKDVYIKIGDENMQIKSVDGNTLTVYRGIDNSVVSSHDIGTSIDVLNVLDDALIELDDDFGFNSDVEFFGDFKTYSPTLGQDV